VNSDDLFENWKKGGDIEAFSVLVAQLRKRVHAIARRRLNGEQEIEDIFQEVVTRLLEKKAIINDETHFEALATIYTVRAISERRRITSRFIADIEEADVPVDAGQLSELEGKERLAIYGECLHLLSDSYRTVIRLIYREGLTPAEAAKVLDTSEKQVTNLRDNARKRLKELVVNWRGRSA